MRKFWRWLFGKHDHGRVAIVELEAPELPEPRADQVGAWLDEAPQANEDEVYFRAPPLRMDRVKVELRPPSLFTNQDWHPGERLVVIRDSEL